MLDATPSAIHQLSLVPPQVAPSIWATVEPMIEKAITRSHANNITTPQHQLCAILLGNAQLWVAQDGRQIDAAIITRFITWDTGKKTLYVPIIGGHNMKAWLPAALETLKAHAQRTGCMDLRGEFRKGWARVAGFQITGVNLKLGLD
jgi:hypothetical protein